MWISSYCELSEILSSQKREILILHNLFSLSELVLFFKFENYDNQKKLYSHCIGMKDSMNNIPIIPA